MTFEDRLSHALEWEIQVRDALNEIGFLTNPYGQGVQLDPEFRNAIRRMNSNKTAVFVRYLPDWIVAMKNKACYLVEAKSTMSSTPNYSYELASHRIGMDLHSIGVDVIVVFSEWRASFVHDLLFVRKFEGDQLNYVKGSRTPFGLIRKESVPSFTEFFESLQPSDR